MTLCDIPNLTFIFRRLQSHGRPQRLNWFSDCSFFTTLLGTNLRKLNRYRWI